MSRMLTCGCLLLFVVAGCNKGEPKQEAAAGASEAGGPVVVGVVDMDRAAKELGLSQRLLDMLKEREQQLQSLLGDLGSKLKAQLENKKKQAGSTPSQKDREELQNLEMQLGQLFNNARSQLQGQFQGIRGNLIHQIRTAFKQKIASIAQTKKISVVLEASNDPTVATTVLYSSTGVDITNDLIEGLKGEVAGIKLDAPSFPTTSPEINFGDNTPARATTGGATPAPPATPGAGPMPTPVAPTPGTTPGRTVPPPTPPAPPAPPVGTTTAGR